MLHSMTGFAARKGAALGYSWSWDLRSVNAKGLDLRLRVPDWIEGLEPTLRADLGKAMARGSVTLSLRVQKDEEDSQQALNPSQLDVVLDAISEIGSRAAMRGIELGPSRASDIVALKGILDTASSETDTAALKAAIVKELPDLVAGFLEMRRNEGEALDGVLKDQLKQVSELTEQAEGAAEQRREDVQTRFRENVARIVENADNLDEARIAQELALIAVKQDVTEELDRLRAHVGAARDLLAKGSPVGRKLDFLMQEFNREANTLCSKSQSVELTRIGLDLKAVIDQMREQVQNVE